LVLLTCYLKVVSGPQTFGPIRQKTAKKLKLPQFADLIDTHLLKDWCADRNFQANDLDWPSS
jgi:hypothetical protein